MQMNRGVVENRVVYSDTTGADLSHEPLLSKYDLRKDYRNDTIFHYMTSNESSVLA